MNKKNEPNQEKGPDEKSIKINDKNLLIINYFKFPFILYAWKEGWWKIMKKKKYVKKAKSMQEFFA